MAKAKSNSPKKAKETKGTYVVVGWDFSYWVSEVFNNMTLEAVKRENDFYRGDVYIFEIPSRNKEKETNFIVSKVTA